MEVRSVESIVRTLNDAQVDYLIVGGLAVNAHGFVRLTQDVDRGHSSDARERYEGAACSAGISATRWRSPRVPRRSRTLPRASVGARKKA